MNEQKEGGQPARELIAKVKFWFGKEQDIFKPGLIVEQKEEYAYIYKEPAQRLTIEDLKELGKPGQHKASETTPPMTDNQAQALLFKQAKYRQGKQRQAYLEGDKCPLCGGTLENVEMKGEDILMCDNPECTFTFSD